VQQRGTVGKCLGQHWGLQLHLPVSTQMGRQASKRSIHGTASKQDEALLTATRVLPVTVRLSLPTYTDALVMSLPAVNTTVDTCRRKPKG